MQEACRFVTKNEEETRQLGVRLAELLKPGDVLALEGDLGAGKTTFAQGIAKGLGVEEAVDSPTFTIIKEYHGRLPFYHMDVYRLESPDEDLGWDEFFRGRRHAGGVGRSDRRAASGSHRAHRPHRRGDR